jgi:hypothetical protein
MFEKLRARLTRAKAIAFLMWACALRGLPLPNRMLSSTRAMTTETIIGLAIGVLLLGILLPVGLEAWETYVPTDPTLLIVWPIGAVLIVLGIVMKFYKSD